MEFQQVTHFEKRKKADVLVLPLWKGKERGEWATTLPRSFLNSLSLPLDAGDFKGKEGEILCLYLQDQPEKRVLLLGLGSQDKAKTENLRRAYGTLVKTCLNRRFQNLNIVVPSIASLSEKQVMRGMAEGLLLANHGVDRYKHPEVDEPEPPLLIQKVTLIDPFKEALSIADKALAICEGVYYARDLVNGNADDITPQHLEACARGIAKEFPQVKVTLFDKKRLEKEKMGLLLAVNRGSALDPAFIIMEYRGNPKSKEHVVIVGKGITYDTGGLNIKTAGMETMKCDMGGGAVCFGTMIAVCNLELSINLTVVIPATENCVDAKSFKPGDVYVGYAGKSVEMMNSDAEGRLILADAIAYAVKHLKPTILVDFATLTGAIDIAIGPEATGFMSNDDELAYSFTRAGEETFERVWRMPLYDEYRDRLKSELADIKSWNGRTAGSCVAATFLKEFVGDVPWVHFDIASTAFLSESKKYLPKYATGVGVRLMVEFLENLAK